MTTPARATTCLRRLTRRGRPGTSSHSDDKKRARLNTITHLLAHVPYEELPREKVKLPDRQKAHDYREPDYPFKFVPEMTRPAA